MANCNRRLTVRQWQDAVAAIGHVVFDWEVWESDSDPSAKDLLRGINVLRRLVDDRRPSEDWETLSEGTDEQAGPMD